MRKHSVWKLVYLLVGALLLWPMTFTQQTAKAQGANYTCTITIAPGSYVTMGDGNAILAFTVTNTSPAGGASIDRVQLGFNAGVYDLSEGIYVPDNWKVLSKEAGAGQTWIRYGAQNSSARIAPGASLTFYIPLIGRSNGQFPSAPNDQTDRLDGKYTSVSDASGKNFSCGTLPTWPRKSLAVSVSALPLSLPTGQAIRVELLVANRSTLAHNGIITNLSVSGSGGVSLYQGPEPASLDLLAGASRTQVYTYTAISNGNVLFTTSASRGLYVTSGPSVSDEVWIGEWTASLALSVLSAVNGQEIKVWMTVRNNTLPSAGNVVPTLTSVGSASATLVKGPTPVKINSIPPGSIGIFEWTYRITGNAGQTFQFEGYATDKDGRRTNTARSQAGLLGRYTVIPLPGRVASASTNVVIAFTVYNQGASGIDEIVFTIPPRWTISEANSSGGYNGNWKKDYNPGKRTMTFTVGGISQILPPGAYATFNLFFTVVPTVNVDTAYDFGTGLWSGNTYQGGDTPTVLVTLYRVTLSAVPATLPADGASTSTLTACVSEAGVPIPNAWVSFAATAGTLSAPVALTGANGCASVILIAPISTETLAGMATASYLTAQGQAFLTFTGFDNANPLYVGGTLNPYSAQPGQTVAISVDVINLGTRPMDLGTASYIRISDGVHVYQANLSAPVTLPVDARRTLTFNSALIDPAFTPGTYYPALILYGSVGLSLVQFERPVTDPFVIGAAALDVRLSASPTLVVPHMDVTVTMRVRNIGLYPATQVTPSALVTAGNGSVTLRSGPDPMVVSRLEPGEQTTFTWVYRATGFGQVTWSGQVSAVDEGSGLPFSSSLATSNAVTIARPAELSATFTGPATVNVGQTFTLRLNVVNIGGVAANAIVPDPTEPIVFGPAIVSLVSGPDPASLVTLAPSESGSFAWTYRATARGTLTLNGGVSGQDSVSGRGIGAIATAHQLTIQDPARLRCDLQVTPLMAPTGSTFYVTMTVRNDGEAAAVGVAPSPLTPSGSGAVTLLDGPSGAPATIPSQSSRQFTWQYRGTHAGTVAWRGWAQGSDGNSGDPVTSDSCDSNSVTIQAAPYLVATLIATPDAVGLGETVQVLMRVDNIGEIAAQNVTPSALTLSNPALFTPIGGPVPASADLQAGQSITFTWTYRASSAQTGTNTWQGYASGRNAQTGGQVSSAPVTSNLVYVYDVVPEKVTRTSSPGYAQPNERFTYEIRLRNTSNQNVILQSLRDTLPLGVSYIATLGATVMPAPPTVNGQNVTWSWDTAGVAPTIPAGGVFTLTFQAQVGSVSGTYCNTIAFTRQGGATTLRSDLACFSLGWPEYTIMAQAGAQRIRVRVRLVSGRPVILSWEYVP